MRFQRIIEQVYFRPWFITAEGHAAISRIVKAKVAHESSLFDDFVQQRQPMYLDLNRIARIHVLGVLGQGLSPIEKSCGNTDYEDIAAEIASAQQAGAIGYFFKIDSGGGMCSGCVETARLISDIGVPTACHAKTIMGSAAYALGVGCNLVLGTESALIGSIGTICPWIDSSEMWKQEGLSFEPIVSEGADLKSTMHGPSLEPQQVEHLQELSNDYAAQFVGHVKMHRAPNEEVYRGGAYAGSRAKEYGLIDGCVTEEEAYRLLLQKVPRVDT